jgi:hypothetical protein
MHKDKQITVRTWECDRCGKTHDNEPGEMDRPLGWTDEVRNIPPSGEAYSTQVVDICPDCSHKKQLGR